MMKMNFKIVEGLNKKEPNIINWCLLQTSQEKLKWHFKYKIRWSY